MSAQGTAFQCACGPLTLCGDIDPICIVDPTCPPSNIIPSCTDFSVVVKFDITGTVVPLMAGNFKVTVGFESIGPGNEASYSVSVPVTSGPYNAGPPPHRDYAVNVPIPNSNKTLDVGTYLVIAYVTYTDVNGNPGPIAGMSDEKFLEIFPKPQP